VPFPVWPAHSMTCSGVFVLQVRAVTGGYFVAILLVFLGSLVGLKLPGLFSGGEAGGKPWLLCCRPVVALHAGGHSAGL